METTAEVRPTKVATMKYRKNSIEEDEQEIEELEKIRAGEEEAEEGVIPFVKFLSELSGVAVGSEFCCCCFFQSFFAWTGSGL